MRDIGFCEYQVAKKIINPMKKNRNEFKIVFATGFFMYWLLLMIYRPEWYGVVPYKIMNL